MRIVLDTTILVRAASSQGLSSDLVLATITGKNSLVLSSEILHELARVLRYPRIMRRYGLSENRIYDFIDFLRQASQLVPLDPLLTVPIRDVNDIIVVQTAIIGAADLIATTDQDFFEPRLVAFLQASGIAVISDVDLMEHLRQAP